MTALEIALDFIARGWFPLPIPDRSKNPGEILGKGWEDVRITAATAPKHFNGKPLNFGIHLGPSGVTDVDLDWPESIITGAIFLPDGAATFGRVTAPKSHWLYRTTLARTEGKGVILFRCPQKGSGGEERKENVIELRFGDGVQTVFPPSRHKETGEVITWARDCDLSDMDGSELKRACALAAASAVLASGYPGEGGRHNAARALNGFLRRCNLTPREMTLFAHAITGAAKSYAGDRDATRQDLATIEEVKPLAEDKTPGFHSMEEYFDKQIVTLAADWLGYKGQRDSGEREGNGTHDEESKRYNARIIDPRNPWAVANGYLTQLSPAGAALCLHHHRDNFFKWSGKAYIETPETEIRAGLYPYLGESFRQGKEDKIEPVKPTPSLVSNILDGLKGATYLDHTIESPAWICTDHPLAAKDMVACENGLLHLPTGELQKHSPEFFNSFALDFKFDPMAPEPTQFLGFLNQIWPGDHEAINTLQESFGLFLTCDTSQQKALLIVGPPRSGKGTIARVLTGLIGRQNIAAPTLSGLQTNFGLEPLIGKPVAIISDARLSGKADQQAIAERILSITGEDSITIDRKYLKAWTGHLPTRFMILVNKLPKLDDSSGALPSRFIILVLRQSFLGHEDKGLTAKLLTEMPGILNWAITGWHRLNKFGSFKIPESSKDAMQEMADLSSPINAFVRDRCQLDPAYQAGVDRLYAEWLVWCEAEGRDFPGAKQAFCSSLLSANSTLIKVRPRDNVGERYRAYSGIKIREG
jgi:putative DNA primase/helicase